MPKLDLQETDTLEHWALGPTLIIEPIDTNDPSESTTSSGIIITNDKRGPATGRILHVGDAVEIPVEVGFVVRYDAFRAQELVRGELVVHENAIYGVCRKTKA